MPELLRLKANSMINRAQNGDREIAMETYNRSMAVAREMDARSWELRTAIAIARTMVEDGLESDAFALLAPLYDDFPEGQSRSEPAAAKRLIDTLI